ncbi:MAG: MarR family transcriptional regulator [Betaproteobacteria bacterium]|nr:MarR family transcriptional regulator [Betaproteobacteria bacterium]
MVIKEDLSRNFGFILHDVARLLRTTFDRRMKGLGLTRSQWWVLLYVFRSDGATQSELADMLEIEKASLGRLIDRLEAKGWLRREGDANDRRAKRVYLTEAVDPAMKAMRAAAAELRSEALMGLSVADQERFVDTLLSVKGNLLRAENGGATNGLRNNGHKTSSRTVAREGLTTAGMVAERAVPARQLARRSGT